MTPSKFVHNTAYSINHYTLLVTHFNMHFYHYLMSFKTIFSFNYFFYRSLNVLFGLINLSLVYCITAQLHGEKQVKFRIVSFQSKHLPRLKIPLKYFYIDLFSPLDIISVIKKDSATGFS